MNSYDEYVLVSHLELALRHCDNVIKRGEKWNFRCNICGDSKKSKTKRRGWLMKNRRGVWIFNCFNDCGSMGALFWLKKYFPEDYKNYIMESISKKKRSFEKIETKPKPKQIQASPQRRSYPFISIKSEKNKDKELVKKGIQFCIDRKIPEHIWNKFYVCEREKYAGRLIIPFYDNEGKIYYFQARTLTVSGEKYISAEGEKRIYNIYNIDKQKPVMITEGMIDSMFLDNAVAIAGLGMSERNEKELSEINKAYFLLDYDEPGQKKSLKFLKEGKTVFNWYLFQKKFKLPKRDKWDINEVYLYLNRDEPFTFDELKQYFTSNYMDSIYFS